MERWKIEKLNELFETKIRTGLWEGLSDEQKTELVAVFGGDEEIEFLTLLEVMNYEYRAERWEGFSDRQKCEIASCLPAADADVVDDIENSARLYLRRVEDEREEKKKAQIITQCLQLGQKLNDSGFLFHGDREVLAVKEALNVISTRAKRRKRRQPKDNAKQEARAYFMIDLLDAWYDTGGALGGVKSPMVSFFRAAWPQPLLKHRPSNEAIVQWAYKNERKPTRVIRRLSKLMPPKGQMTRKFEDFERKHRKQIQEIMRGYEERIKKQTRS
jgi:hypothetical protein